MDTSILISSNPEDANITCFLKGSLYADDIYDLAGVLQEQVGRQDLNQFKRFNIDITKTHENLFKPYRLFDLCSNVQKKIAHKNREMVLYLIANKLQGELFDSFSIVEDFYVEIREFDDIESSIIEEDELFNKRNIEYNFHDMAVKIMYNWYNKHDKKDEKRYFISGREMSARDIFYEIQEGTPVGIEYRNSLIELGFKYGLKLI